MNDPHKRYAERPPVPLLVTGVAEDRLTINNAGDLLGFHVVSVQGIRNAIKALSDHDVALARAA